MHLLIVSGTAFEIEPLLKEINGEVKDSLFSTHIYQQHRIDILLTGVGIAHTSFYLGKYLSTKYDLVINIGICGSFTQTLSIGDVVCIDEDCFADIGAEDDEKFLSIEELNLPGTYDVINENIFSDTLFDTFRSVKGATVNTAHGNKGSIEKFMLYSHAEIESMEGAAFLFACNQTKVSCRQIRAVSNYVEKRDRSKWNIPLAITNLNKVLIDFINQ
jgi:futalosine hydrolase